MKRCVVLTGGPLSDCDRIRLQTSEQDYIIACDAGLYAARHFSLHPHLVVGDFDSYGGALPQGAEILRASSHKDDTDTMLGLREGLACGCRDFLIVGGFGGRLDHTIANLQSLAFLCDQGAQGSILSNDEQAWMFQNGTLTLQRMEGYFVSVFAWGGVCKGVTLQGLEYPLTDATLTPAFPLGVSNAFDADEAHISVRDGMLLVIASRERRNNSK